MNHPTMTPWYPGDIRPVRNGVYQTKPDKNFPATTAWQHWDGYRWSAFGWTPSHAWQLRKTRSQFQQPMWRGRTAACITPTIQTQ